MRTIDVSKFDVRVSRSENDAHMIFRFGDTYTQVDSAHYSLINPLSGDAKRARIAFVSSDNIADGFELSCDNSKMNRFERVLKRIKEFMETEYAGVKLANLMKKIEGEIKML